MIPTARGSTPRPPVTAADAAVLHVSYWLSHGLCQVERPQAEFQGRRGRLVAEFELVAAGEYDVGRTRVRRGGAARPRGGRRPSSPRYAICGPRCGRPSSSTWSPRRTPRAWPSRLPRGLLASRTNWCRGRRPWSGPRTARTHSTDPRRARIPTTWATRRYVHLTRGEARNGLTVHLPVDVRLRATFGFFHISVRARARSDGPQGQAFCAVQGFRLRAKETGRAGASPWRTMDRRPDQLPMATHASVNTGDAATPSPTSHRGDTRHTAM